jgi:hypothetical protein
MLLCLSKRCEIENIVRNAKVRVKRRILCRKRHGNLELNVTKWEVDREKCERLDEYIDVILVGHCS